MLQELKHKNMYFGVHQTFDQVLDEKPWEQKGWDQLQRNKMSEIIPATNTTKVFIPEPILRGYIVTPCLIVNMLSAKGKCRVLDFAGGNGFTYYKIQSYLTSLPNVDWHVVDSNETGLELGKNFSLKDNHIRFSNCLPNSDTIQYDVLYINTSLQYIEDYESLLRELLLYNPSFLVFTRLLAGKIEPYVTSQEVMGKRTPCKFINIDRFSRFLESQGYKLIFKSPTEEILQDYFDGVPDNFKIPFSLTLVYTKNN
jgi:putative methyltransferase (TIGR04325 family)